MHLEIKPGCYVVAVSGGVDSVVLLDLLVKQKDLTLTVAHYDHGMRTDSAQDCQFVQALAKKVGLPFVYREGHLGERASEAQARQARYEFLRETRQSAEAQAIVTAHHQDDVLETAILNMLRGTGRKGLTALKNQPDILRPLLHIPKRELMDYAQKHQIEWREDSSNTNVKYLRNYIRHNILPRFNTVETAKMVSILTKSTVLSAELDTELAKLFKDASAGIERQWFSQLPHAVAKETLAEWLRQHDLRDFDSKTVERLVTAAKTAKAGKEFPVIHGAEMLVHKDNLALRLPER